MVEAWHAFPYHSGTDLLHHPYSDARCFVRSEQAHRTSKVDAVGDDREHVSDTRHCRDYMHAASTGSLRRVQDRP